MLLLPVTSITIIKNNATRCLKSFALLHCLKKTVLVCRRKLYVVDVPRIRVGCSTTRIPLRIVRLIVLTTAVTTPRTMPRCGPGCSGRSAPWKGL